MGEIAWLGCDWGTTSLRVYAVDAQGQVLDKRVSDLGLVAAREHGFEQALSDVAGDWLHPQRLVMLSGMVGARGGWHEAPYCPCPAGFTEIAKATRRVPTDLAQVHIVPGLCLTDGEQPEVIRGEETQLCGVLASGGGDGTYVLPGSHTKWVKVEDSKIETFTTYMSGDVFRAMSEHTVLGALLPPQDKWDWDAGGFAQGVEVGAKAESGGALLNSFFGTRTLGLFDRLPKEQLGPYLSGLILGAELNSAGANASWVQWPATLVGDTDIVARYRAAGKLLGLEFNAADPDVVVVGLAALAAALPDANS